MFDLLEVFCNKTWNIVATELFFSSPKKSGVHNRKFLKKRSEKESVGLVTRNMLFDIFLALKNEFLDL